MVKVKEDLTGRVFGRLTVIKQVDDYIEPKSGKHRSQWLCLCSCDKHKEVIVIGYNLKKKNGTRSCGCLWKEKICEANKIENKFDLESEDYAIGYTNKGEPFWFDKEDIDLVKKYSWYYSSSGYVTHKDSNGVIFLHRLVMNVTDPNIEVDHKQHPPKNENKYDNRKSNLELVTHSENQMNLSLRADNKSGVAGVFWLKDKNKWWAYITIHKKRINLGYFSKKEDAIEARKNAEVEYFGDRRYGANN